MMKIEIKARCPECKCQDIKEKIIYGTTKMIQCYKCKALFKLS